MSSLQRRWISSAGGGLHLPGGCEAGIAGRLPAPASGQSESALKFVPTVLWVWG
ncbi:hypothetical protein RHOER0001_4531 [Rhodococcus erythropolis SK121]|nr:hypothetical protein RHOER0001_4531 [Rhodococcus erythropolis SK121]